MAIHPDLPEMCYHVHDVTGAPVIIKRGVTGFFPTSYPAENGEAVVARLNEQLGVSGAQQQAMLAGSLFGFNLPIADPTIYQHHA